MSFEFHELPGGRRSSATLESAGFVRRTHELRYQTTSDSKYVSSWDVQVALCSFLGITYGGVYGTDTPAILKAVDTNCSDDTGFVYETSITYETQSAEEEKRTENPLDQPPDISWDSELFTRPIDIDVNNNPIVNSAGDKYDPTVEAEYYFPALTIVRNEAAYDPAIQTAFQGKVNSGTWLGFAAKRVKCTKISSQLQRLKIDDDSTFIYWTTTYHFLFATLDPYWKRKILDAGYNFLDSSGSSGSSGGRTKRRCLVNGIPSADPQKLDGNGNQLSSTGTAVWNTFEVCTAVDFTPLNLEQYF